MVGGLFLHTTRKRVEARCPPGSFAALYDPQCTRGAVGNAKNATALDEFLQKLHAGGGAGAPAGRPCQHPRPQQLLPWRRALGKAAHCRAPSPRMHS